MQANSTCLIDMKLKLLLNTFFALSFEVKLPHSWPFLCNSMFYWLQVIWTRKRERDLIYKFTQQQHHAYYLTITVIWTKSFPATYKASLRPLWSQTEAERTQCDWIRSGFGRQLCPFVIGQCREVTILWGKTLARRSSQNSCILVTLS